MELSQFHNLDNVFFELTRLDSNHFIVFFYEEFFQYHNSTIN
jgi:hypothetical protein